MKALDLSAGRLPCPTAGHELCRSDQAISAYSLTVTCMVSFGDSKHEPVKSLHRLLDATPSILALSAKCTIHDVSVSLFIFQSVSLSFLLHCLFVRALAKQALLQVLDLALVGATCKCACF